MPIKYKVQIDTLDGQSYVQMIESSSDSQTVCDRIFNETPNVRSVEVISYDSKETISSWF